MRVRTILTVAYPDRTFKTHYLEYENELMYVIINSTPFKGLWRLDDVRRGGNIFLKSRWAKGKLAEAMTDKGYYE